MKALYKITTILAVILLIGFAMPASALAPEHEITAQSVILIDAQTGQLLYGRDMHLQLYPASITKIMTGLLAMENYSPNKIPVVSESAMDFMSESSHIALTPGEEIPMDSLMYALMLPSANDAANVIAEHIAGNQEAFARMMTERVMEIGAFNTNFTNAHGLPDDGRHYTTAYDMALITREAIRNPAFLHYFGTRRQTIPATNKQPEERNFTNQNFMLLPDQRWAYYTYAIGGKVGFTGAARHTISSAAYRDGRTLIAVVMGCGHDERFHYTRELFEFGFESFTLISLEDTVLTPAPVPLMYGDMVIGEATFFLPDEKLTMLVPNGIGEEALVYSHNLPDYMQKDEPVTASVSITVNGAPGVMLDIPLTKHITVWEYAPTFTALSGDTNRQEAVRDGDFYLLWIIPILIAMAALFVYVDALKRKRARIRRMRNRRTGRWMS